MCNLYIKVLSGDVWRPVRDDRTTNVDVWDVCLLFITAPYISDIWYSCTYRSRCRACCSDNAWAAGQTILWRYITQVVIALWLFTRRPAHTPPSADAVPLAAQPTLDTAKVPMSLSLTSCTVEQRRREHGVTSTWFWNRWTVTYFRAHSVTMSLKCGD